MKIISEKEVNAMTPEQRQIELDRLEDLMCNTDYTTNEGSILYGFYADSANNIINKNFGEY